MAKSKNSKTIGLILFGVAFMVLIIAIVSFIVNNGNSTDVEISDSRDVSGIRCTSNNKMSFVFEKVAPISYENIITASFMDDALASLSLEYKGKYSGEAEADHARDLAESQYNSSMTEQYGLAITDFSRNISVNGDTLYATITATNNKNLNSKTASVFILSNTQNFPNSLQSMKAAYENAGFVCTTNN